MTCQACETSENAQERYEMLKTKAVDFHAVPSDQAAMDAKLRNWAAWVKPRSPSWISPMFRQAQSNSRQWHTPEVRETCDVLGAQAMEKAVYHLPDAHKLVIRWHYVFPVSPAKVCRELGVTMDQLGRLVCDGRRMLINRGH